MQREFRWTLVAFAVLVSGALCAESYARLAAPCHEALARLIAVGHPWRILAVKVAPGKSSPSSELQLTGEVRRDSADRKPAAVIVSHVQVGEAVETPVVFWTVLLLWPATSARQRWIRFTLAVPVFVGLETATTTWQLVHSMADASAMLAGDRDPLTLGDRWAQFLESGGRFAIELGAALLAVSR